MAERSSRPRQRVDRDGVKTIETPGVRRGVWLLAAAMGLVGLAIWVVVRPALERGRPAPAEVQAEDRAADVAAPRATAVPPRRPAAALPEVPRPPEVEERPVWETEDLAAEDEPSPDEVSDETDEAGDELTGIALFPPPGTQPIQPGIIVPEGFELPPGFVRHYQVTDEGERLPPILMFHPDYQPVDDNGDPIPLPADRIVPPEMAPPGISVQILEAPENLVPMIEMPDSGEPPVKGEGTRGRYGSQR